MGTECSLDSYVSVSVFLKTEYFYCSGRKARAPYPNNAVQPGRPKRHCTRPPFATWKAESARARRPQKLQKRDTELASLIETGHFPGGIGSRGALWMRGFCQLRVRANERARPARTQRRRRHRVHRGAAAPLSAGGGEGRLGRVPERRRSSLSTRSRSRRSAAAATAASEAQSMRWCWIVPCAGVGLCVCARARARAGGAERIGWLGGPRMGPAPARLRTPR